MSCPNEKLRGPNSKSEARIPKQTAKFKTTMFKTSRPKSDAKVLDIEICRLAVCFGFRASCFEFCHGSGPELLPADLKCPPTEIYLFHRGFLADCV
jgi:hypothetical protein